MNRQKTIDSMRDMLNFLEENPSIVMPNFSETNVFYLDKDQLPAITKAMSPCVKGVFGQFFEIKRQFGDLTLIANFPREKVCERIVIGTEIIPRKVTEEFERDIVEWKCPESILATNSKETP